MKLWMRKIAVVIVAIMTFGFYVPPGLNAEVEAEDNKNELSHSGLSEETVASVSETTKEEEHDFELQEDTHVQLHTLTDQAKVQTLMKLGPRITNQLDNHFMDTILLNIEDTLDQLLSEIPEEKHDYLKLTETPADGLAEKIFHIYDADTNEDIIRFHVRRDHRPWEGYWFNFHYHVNDDNFEGHHEIGEIFWDKNMPPKWMA
jgi:phage terminase Nu1 subunit (DNA packaging protein)